MLVYGDRRQRIEVGERLDEIETALRRLPTMPGGIARHGALAAAFIDAAELAQGVADAEFAARGDIDDRSRASDAAMAVVQALAAGLWRSWQSGFADFGRLPLAELAALRRADPPDIVAVTRPEGFAFYAVYPEAYATAALALSSGPAPIVIGIRSIGTALAAMVAAALGSGPPVTVRPTGHPFDRRIRVSDRLEGALLASRSSRFAIVDEGPGLSGSSFAAVAKWLDERGVARERIRFFPSHDSAPGPQASPDTLARWRRSFRHAVTVDRLILGAGRSVHRLENWFADALGPAEAPLQDLSGGAWRDERFGSEADWPPAQVMQERRKFLLRTKAGIWLIKFAGLGREGETKFERARALSQAGFVPEPIAFRHGFSAERWHGEARPLDVFRVERSTFLERLGRYLGFRAKRFATDADRGAGLDRLSRMARANAAEALGEEAARALERLAPAIPRLERSMRRVETDGRLHAWEWLALPDGRVLKADALDHHAAHDLVGAQDIAWDAAGAVHEFDLSPDERRDLCATIGHAAGRPVDPDLVHFLEPCYLAFQLGAFTLAADAAGFWPEEAARLRAQAGNYERRLSRLLRGLGST